MGIKSHTIEHSVQVHAPSERIWHEVTQVDIANFRHPWYLRLIGVPQPLRAEILEAGLGGTRIATFSNGLRFSQQITDWLPGARYAFTFHPDPGFQVAFCLDLSRGPFRMASGAYRIEPGLGVARLFLSSRYELHGVLGALLKWPVRLALHFFQSSLLRGIKENAERRGHSATH